MAMKLGYSMDSDGGGELAPSGLRAGQFPYPFPSTLKGVIREQGWEPVVLWVGVDGGGGLRRLLHRGGDAAVSVRRQALYIPIHGDLRAIYGPVALVTPVYALRRSESLRSTKRRRRGYLRVARVFPIRTAALRDSIMRENDRTAAEADSATGEKQTEAGSPRAIRFSDSKWKRVKFAAQQHHIPAAEFVRNAALAVVDGKSSAGSVALTPGIVELIEHTYRSAYILSTLKRDAMVREGHGEELGRVIESAQRSQVSLLIQASE